MSENAIHVHAAASATGTPSLSLAAGPGALRTTLLMARITFLEAARRKILWIATLAGIGVPGLFLDRSSFRDSRTATRQANTVSLREAIVMMTMMVLYAGSMMTSLMAVLTSCDTLSGEIASGTIHAIATKPVERWCLVLGKWVGFVGMLTLYVSLIEGGTDRAQLAPEWLLASSLPCRA